MKKLLLNIYYWFMLCILTLLFLVIFPFFLLVSTVFLKRTLASGIRWAIVIYGWVLVTVVPFFAPVRFESQTGELPFPAIIVANHSSAIDPYLFGTLFTEMSIVTTWPFKIPIYGVFMRLAGYIDANEGWEKVCEKGANILQAGASLIIWPEGHRSRDGSLGRFKNGAFALAVKSGYPLLPVCIVGSREFLMPGKKIMSPSRIKLIALSPIYPDMQNDQEQEIIRLRIHVKEAIRKALEEDKRQSQNQQYAAGFERGEQC